jgi:arylsulfatase A
MKHLRLLLTTALFVAISASAADQPNFVVINIDDLGYGDIAPFGSKLNRTPNLDRMAAEGRKLTCFYAAPVCSPSRAALMTGCYPKRVLPIPGVLFPAASVGLNPAEHTVAELLKAVGYSTACIGKWHLGDQPPFLPTRRGSHSFFEAGSGFRAAGCAPAPPHFSERRLKIASKARRIEERRTFHLLAQSRAELD